MSNDSSPWQAARSPGLAAEHVKLPQSFALLGTGLTLEVIAPEQMPISITSLNDRTTTTIQNSPLFCKCLNRVARTRDKALVEYCFGKLLRRVKPARPDFTTVVDLVVLARENKKWIF
jgi:hypothetical protein